jgi:hypothetical protein
MWPGLLAICAAPALGVQLLAAEHRAWRGGVSDSEFFQPKPGEPRVCGQLMNVLYTDTSPVVYVEPGQLDIPKDQVFSNFKFRFTALPLRKT